MTTDPIRLFEDPAADSALRADLQHASEAGLHGFDPAAGLVQLQAATAAGAAKATGLSLLGKVGIGTAVAGAAVGAWLLGQPSHSDGPQQAVAVHRPDVEPVGPASAAGIDEVAAPVLAPSLPESEPIPVPEEPAAVPAEAPAADDAALPVEEATPEAAPAPRRNASKAASPIDDAVLREARAIGRAKAKLKSAPATTLQIVRDAAREFPGGQLVEERRALEIRALVALGHGDEARRLAEGFLADHGGGTQAAALRRALQRLASDPFAAQ